MTAFEVIKYTLNNSDCWFFSLCGETDCLLRERFEPIRCPNFRLYDFKYLESFEILNYLNVLSEGMEL